MDSLLAMLSGMNLNDRRWLAKQLIAQLEREEETEKNAEVLKAQDEAKLEAFLSKVSGDWGGDKTPVEIANELRQGSDMVKDVEVW